MAELHRRASAQPLPGIWDRTLLAQLVAINAHLIEALVQAASRGGHCVPTSLLRADWLRLTAEQRLRLADCPYLLVDAGFADPTGWLTIPPVGVRDMPDPRRAIHAAIGWVEPSLIRRALILAWHLARSNPLLARVALGMNERCMELIAACGLHDLESLAELRPAWIRIRWDDQPQIWQQLVQAAAAGQDASLRRLQLRGLQLLAAGLGEGPKSGGNAPS